MTRRGQSIVLGVTGLVTAALFFLLAEGTLVLNGSTSLSHTGYIMLRWPQMLSRGVYVAFAPPARLADHFEGVSFIKRIVGVAGDRVVSDGARVCIAGTCRELLPDLRADGVLALEVGVIPEGFIAVFGDSPDSLDSRYAVVGLVPTTDVQAAGIPVPMPHWREVQSWLHG